MNFSRLILVAAISLFAVLSSGSALAANCDSAPMHGDNGAYNGCEVVHGPDVQFRDAESVTEEACPHICEALGEIDALAAESKELDEKAGF